MATQAQAKKAEELKSKLFDKDELVVLKTLEALAENGTIHLVEPLIVLFASTKNDEIKNKTADMLGTLKVSGAESAFIKALHNKELKAIRKDVISFIWSSGIQPVEELATFAQIATDGSFEEALECLTLLDSLETAIPEAALLESITTVKQHLAKNTNEDKTALLKQFLLALENQRIED